MPEQYNPFWDTSAGGFTRDYSGTVSRVEFAAGKFNFQATITTKLDEPEVGNDGQLRIENWEYVTIGGLEQWQALDGGSRFQGAKNPDAKVVHNTDFGRLINRVKDLMTDAGRLSELGDPRDEKTWLGLRFHWQTEDIPYKGFKDREGNERPAGVKQQVMPQELLDGSGAAPAFSLDSLALAPDQLAYLEAAANDSTTLGEFQAAVMPWMHKGETGLSDSQKAGLTSAVATNDGWMAIRTLI